jgi:hypothetical protein
MRALRPLAAVCLTLAIGCSDKKAAPAAAAGTERVDPATAGAIVGKVSFAGTPPANPPVKISADPACALSNPDGLAFENWLVSDGGLDNVFVYVKDGLGNYYFDTPTEPVKVDQRGCRYVPHVVGVRVGQPLEIGNSDATTHNIHSLPEANREVNLAQYKAGQKNLETFTVAEVMVPLKCDLHSWMRAYAGVVDHPYFAVTSNGGRFELKNLPPGTYTLEAWHEKGGRQTQQVTVGAKEMKTIAFTYKAESTN